MNPIRIACALLFLTTLTHAAKPAKRGESSAEQSQEMPKDELDARQLKILEGLNFQDHIVYKTVNGESLEMILLLPKEKKAGKIPFVVYTHGGGWGGGDKYVFTQANSMGTVQTLLENGIGFASVQYRLTRMGKSTAYDCVVDCKDAVRFLMKNADAYGLDPTRIAVWGGSAGGHLSLMTALAPNEPFKGDPALAEFSPTFKGVLSYFPLTSFLNPEILKGSNFERPQRFVSMFGGELKDKMDLAKLLSPSEYLTKASPPVYLIHGDSDRVLSIKNSEYLKEVAEAKGAELHLTTVKGGDHGFRNGVSPTQREINAEGAAFLMKQLKP